MMRPSDCIIDSIMLSAIYGRTMRLNDWLQQHAYGDGVTAMVNAFRKHPDPRVRMISAGTIHAHARESRAYIHEHVCAAISEYTLACACERCARYKSRKARVAASVSTQELDDACRRVYETTQASSVAA